MLKQAFFGTILVGTALCISISTSALADDARHHRHRRHHRSAAHHDHHHRPTHARQHHTAHHHRQPHHIHQQHHAHRHRPHHHHHAHQHRPHNSFHVGIIVGAPVPYPVYPHGHHAHIHDAHCPVVIQKHVHHHIYTAPVWDVHYAPLQAPSASTFLFLEISPGQAELYVDGHYLGHANSLHNGRMQIPVAPGVHTIQLQLHGTAYTKTVEVHPGRTAIVKARLL